MTPNKVLIGRLPNFLIIGANKAGTTSLYHYLGQHPEIFMSPVKEPMFFTLASQKILQDSAEQKQVLNGAINNISEYKKLFAGANHEKAFGEASTAYLANPKCADLIKEYTQEIKLVAILRNPVERAFSNYRMYRRWGFENRSFEKAVTDEISGNAGNLPQGQQYLKLGLYADSLAYFYSKFDGRQIKIFLFEEFLNREDFFREVFRFLTVDESFKVDTSQKHNAADSNKLKGIYRKLVGGDRLKSETRKLLIEYFKENILRTESIIQKPLSHWLD